MSCSTKKEDLIAFIYGELDRQKSKLLKQHIEICSECKEEVTSLTAERNILSKWEIDVPEMDLELVKEKQSLITKIKEFLKPQSIKPIRIGYSLVGVLVLILLVLSLINFEFNYDTSGISLRMSIFGKEQEIEREYLQNLLQNQQETFNLIMQIIAKSEENLKQERDIIVTQLFEEIQNQREADMQLIGQNISYFSGVTAEKFKQNDELLGRLIYLTEGNISR